MSGSMTASPLFRGRRAATVENGDLRVTVLEEGGHIAEIFDKQTGLNPLWIPIWPSIEPSAYHVDRHAEYGSGGFGAFGTSANGTTMIG